MADDQLNGPAAFEAMIARARAGEVSRAQLILSFLDTVVVVPSGSALEDGRGSLQPVLIEREGTTWMVAYTSLEGAKQVQHLAPYAVTLPGSTVIAGLAPGTGLVVNPDGTGFEVEPSLVAAIQRDQAQRRRE